MIPRSFLMIVALTQMIGCSSHGDPWRNAHAVAPAVYDQIHPGTSADWLISHLGKPTYTRAIGPGCEIWRWTYSEHRQADGSTVLLFNIPNKKGATGTVYVELKDGIVSRKSRG